MGNFQNKPIFMSVEVFCFKSACKTTLNGFFFNIYIPQRQISNKTSEDLNYY